MRRFMAAVLSGALMFVALPTVAQVTDGLVDDAFLDGIAKRRTAEFREVSNNIGWDDKRVAWTRPCADGAAIKEHQEAIHLRHSAITLAPRHKGDLTCALAEKGHIVFGRSLTRGGLGRLYIDYDGKTMLTLEFVQGDSQDDIADIALVKTQWSGQIILFQDLPREAISRNKRARYKDMRGTPGAGLAFLKTLLGDGDFDLSALGLNVPSSLADAKLSKPLLACGVAKRDNAVLRRALFEKDVKDGVCKRLLTYQIEQHAKSHPDARTVRRLLILALARSFPESDIKQPNGTRLIYEHSAAGIRMIILNNLLPELIALPRISTAVRKVTLKGCKGPKAGPIRCEVRARVERFGSAGNMPGSVQREILETVLSGEAEYEVALDLALQRKGARWEVVDDAEVAAGLMNVADAEIIRGMRESLLRGLRQN